MENQKELMVLLRQNVNKATTCLDIQKDVLPKPLDTELDMDQLCMQLSEDSFNKTMVTIMIYYDQFGWSSVYATTL